MLSYRHAFHAGNHADVLKHLAQVLILDYLRQAKPDKPLCYIDTHAGPGGYSLVEGYATRKAEHAAGVARLWHAGRLPAPLLRYLEVIRGFNPGGEPTHYPGSPAIARQLLGEQDRLELFELHPTEFEALQLWSQGDRRIHVHREDGLQRLPALLPPRERRALVLIDPPYEVKADYARVPEILRTSLRRFASGVYVLWYPLLAHPEAEAMTQSLGGLPCTFLQVELQVRDAAQGGLYGSGLFIINPPWTLEDQLRECLDALRKHLAQDQACRSSIRAGSPA